MHMCYFLSGKSGSYSEWEGSGALPSFLCRRLLVMPDLGREPEVCGGTLTAISTDAAD